jgi:hypothetical protein
MKEYNIYKSVDYYNVKYSDGYGSSYKTYEECVKDVSKYYTMGNFVEVESESEIASRLQKEKASNRNDKIDQILG